MSAIKMQFDNNGICELIEPRKSDAEGGTQSAYIFSNKFGDYQTRDQAFAVVTQPANMNEPPTIKYQLRGMLDGAQWTAANTALNALVDRWTRDHVAAVRITEQSKNLFIAYAKDANNWSGTPMVGGNVGGSKADSGNLTQLKKAKLLSTFRSDGDEFVAFTPLGCAYARANGVEM